MQVTVQLHIVQTGDAAVRLLLAVRCTDGQRRHGRGEGLSKVEHAKCGVFMEHI